MADAGQASEADFNEAYKRVVALANERPDVKGDWLAFLTVKRREPAFRDLLADFHVLLPDDDGAFAKGLPHLGFPTAPGALSKPQETKLYTDMDFVPPSSLTKPQHINDFQAKASKETRTQWPTILYFRPGESAMPWPPAQLVHPVFGSFCDDMQRTGRVTQADIVFLAALCEASTKYHDSEAKRAEAVLPILCDILRGEQSEFPDFAPLLAHGSQRNLSSQLGGNLGGRPDFIVYTQEGLVLAFGEIKNEISLGGGADPCLQGAMAYYNYWTHEDRNTTNTFRHTCCPALLVEVIGPYVRISALTFLHRVMVQPLTPLLHVYPAFQHDPEHMRRLVAMLAALRCAAAELHSYYCEVSSSLAGTTPANTAQLDALQARRVPVLYALRDDEHDEDLMLPYPLQHRAAKEAVPSEQKLVYRVTSDSPADGRIVKFCQRYGETVHAEWAKHSCAPELHFCEQLPGGFYHVEMEDLSPAAGWQMLCTMARKGDSRVGAARDAARNKLNEAHRIGGVAGVHGDVRENNVMVRFVDGVPEPEVRFIDFDWSGMDGDVRYPLFMNPSVRWPEGVRGEAVMRQDHDIQLLRATSQRRHVQVHTRRPTAADAKRARPRWVGCPISTRLKPALCF